MASQPQPPTAESTESSNTPPQLLTPAGTTTTTTSTTHSTTDDLKSPETDSIKIPLSKVKTFNELYLFIFIDNSTQGS